MPRAMANTFPGNKHKINIWYHSPSIMKQFWPKFSSLPKSSTSSWSQPRMKHYQGGIGVVDIRLGALLISYCHGTNHQELGAWSNTYLSARGWEGQKSGWGMAGFSAQDLTRLKSKRWPSWVWIWKFWGQIPLPSWCGSVSEFNPLQLQDGGPPLHAHCQPGTDTGVTQSSQPCGRLLSTANREPLISLFTFQIFKESRFLSRHWSGQVHPGKSLYLTWAMP